MEQLPHALAGTRERLKGKAGEGAYYRSIPVAKGSARPLLLVHSVNAAAGAHEVRPVFEHYSLQRPVYALDLPGYGHSDRSEREYLPRLMTDAIEDVLGQITRDCGSTPVDALALSLSCEFVARAATELPGMFNTVALVSPTGFNRREPARGAPGTNRGVSWAHRLLTSPGLGNGLFRLLTCRASVRFFLQKTWGSKQIDEAMFEYACITARVPGASRAPFRFLSAYLFSADIGRVYEALAQPVWMSHGVRGDFTDYRLKSHFQQYKNWRFQVFDTGALPFFEAPAEFFAAYDQFLASAAQ